VQPDTVVLVMTNYFSALMLLYNSCCITAAKKVIPSSLFVRLFVCRQRDCSKCCRRIVVGFFCLRSIGRTVNAEVDLQ